MPKVTSDLMKTIILPVLALLIAPFLVNCFFAYPQTDDFFYSASGRDAGFLKTQYDVYSTWSGRFTSTALLSINPLVYDSIWGYRLVLAVVLLAQLASLNLLIGVLTKKALSFKENLIFSLAFLFALLDQMDDIRSGLYWMAGVMTYQVAAILMMLFFSLFLLVSREPRFDSFIAKTAVVLLGIVIGGTNEISLALTFLLTTLLILFRFIVERSVNRLHVITFLAVTTGTCLGLFAPGNFVRMSDYGSHRDIFLIAANTLSRSLSCMVVWATSPLVLVLMAVVFFTVISRHQLRSAFKGINVLHSMTIFLFLVFTSFFIPYWSTGMFPQNRVLNLIYFLFLVGWMFNLAAISANLAEPALNLLKNANLKMWGFVAAAYIVLMLGLQTSNFALVSKDLFSGTSHRYSEEMLQIRARLLDPANNICTVADIENKPYSLYFYFVAMDPEHWVNRSYAVYHRKKSIALTGEKGL